MAQDTALFVCEWDLSEKKCEKFPLMMLWDYIARSKSEWKEEQLMQEARQPQVLTGGSNEMSSPPLRELLAEAVFVGAVFMALVVLIVTSVRP